MLKKAKAEMGSQIDQARELSQTVFNSSHQIWLAGLGAFARAQQEGMKMFDTLVRQGQKLETRTRQAASDTATAARDAATAKAKEMQQMAGGTWDKLEQVFEDRVARALSKLGVYTQNDVQQLVQRVDALSEAVNRLIVSGGGAAVPGLVRSSRKTAAGAARSAAKGSVRKSAAKAPPKRAAKASKKTAAKAAAVEAPRAPKRGARKAASAPEA
jgi:poly(hydroxyalkanoate) granule-associated protein